MADVHITSWEFCQGTLQTALCSIQLAEGRQRAFLILTFQENMLPIQNYMVLNGDISSRQITCGLTYLKGHVQHRSRHDTAHAKLTSLADIILF